MPVARLSREEALDRIAEVFRARGYEGASLALLSEATGLGRASLYHHFPGGKEQMGREVFAHLGTRVSRDLIDPLRQPGDPEKRLRAWTKGVLRFYANGCKNCLLGAMVLGGGQDLYAEHIENTFRAVIDALAALLREAGLTRGLARRRARAAMALIQGGLVTARGLRDESVFRTLVRDLSASLLASPGA